MYEILSKIYDLSMKDTNYKKWYNIIKKSIDHSDTPIHHILELGLGSGNITTQLLEKGYEVVGIDKSLEMLDIAREKTSKYSDKIILLNQDITRLDFEIYEIDMIIACNDVINYVYTEKDLKNLFCFAQKHLKKDGIFLFDYSSIYKFENILDSNVFQEEFEEYYYVWKNFYHRSEKKLEIQIDIFELQKDNSYIRYQENHTQISYPCEYITDLLKKSGFKKISPFCDFDENNTNYNSCNRLFFYVQK